jgi:hypothetical protein
MTAPTPASQGTPEWSAQITDRFVETVDRVREATTGPVLKAARGIVYGFVIAVTGVMLLVLLIVALVRVLDIAIPGEVWSAYLVLGLVSCLAGAVAWRRRTA